MLNLGMLLKGSGGRMKAISCEKCPCLNNDYESGSDCNLGYGSDYVEVSDEKWLDVSNDCKLTSILNNGKVFCPEKIEISDSFIEARKIQKEKLHEYKMRNDAFYKLNYDVILTMTKGIYDDCLSPSPFLGLLNKAERKDK